MVFPTTAEVVPDRSQVKRSLARARATAEVSTKFSCVTKGVTCTVTVAGAESAPSESRTW
ncbi:hypothetical protein D3C84_1070030 [compost metagenome]